MNMWEFFNDNGFIAFCTLIGAVTVCAFVSGLVVKTMDFVCILVRGWPGNKKVVSKTNTDQSTLDYDYLDNVTDPEKDYS